MCPQAQRDRRQPKSATQMIKSLTALTIFALLGTSVVVLPGFAPRANADQTVALAKADRLHVRIIAKSCSGQIWPRLDASCLRDVRSGMPVHEARLVTPG
jgi:hypothetical protein